eukprot:11377490-Heterocapsa_arctica.AAC.1
MAYQSSEVAGVLDEPLVMAGVACGFPRASRSTSEFFAARCKGSDGAVEVPFVRWELEVVFDANPTPRARCTRATAASSRAPTCRQRVLRDLVAGGAGHGPAAA